MAWSVLPLRTLSAADMERAVALSLVVGWVCLYVAARWAWRFILGGR